jgi:putative phage-type endonuclease
MRITKIPFSDRTNWLELRRNAIGGSDAAAILGLSKWSSPLAVYADKMGLVPEKEDNEAMRQGRDLEEYVAQRFTEQTGLAVRRENHILVNDVNPFMHANIDRRIVGKNIGLECKTTSVYNDTDFEGGDVPPEYYTQCQHYMAVTGWDFWYLAVLVLNKGFYVFEVPRNEDDIAALIEVERNFWNNHIATKTPPEPIEQDDETIKKLYPHAETSYAPLYSVSPTIRELIEKKAVAKQLEGEIKTLENRIKMAMGDASEGSDGIHTITWKTTISNRFDTKAFKVKHPDLYKQFTNETSSRRFLLKANKESKESIA